MQYHARLSCKKNKHSLQKLNAINVINMFKVLISAGIECVWTRFYLTSYTELAGFKVCTKGCDQWGMLLKYTKDHPQLNMFKCNILILDKACRLLLFAVWISLHSAVPGECTAHLLTLVVRCGFPKPLTVDPLTISLVDSLLLSVLSCVKFSCLPLLWLKHWCLFLTIHGSRQATETKSHGQAAIRKGFSSPGPQEGKCRLSQLSTSTAEIFFFSSQCPEQ